MRFAIPPRFSARPGPGREQQRVEQRDQRRALAAGGDVAGAQVGDDGDAGALGDPRGLADLQRALDASPSSTQW